MGRSSVFGLKFGVNFSDIAGTETDGDPTGYFGTEVYAALFSEFKLRGKWRFENELLFSYTDDYYFLEIPFHFKYNFSKKWHVFAGPKLDLALSEDDEYYNFNNLSLAFDLGVQYDLSRNFL